MGFVLFIKSCTIIFLIWIVFYLMISQIKYYSEPEKDVFSGREAGDVIIERSDGMKEKIMKVCMKVQGKWVEMPNVEGVYQIDENGNIIDSYIREKKNNKEKNMREIKVGDKVKVISITHEDTDCCPIVGNIYTVIEIRKCPFSGSDYAIFKEVNSKGQPLECYLFNCKLVDEKEKQFKKSDLKNGDIVELRNGLRATVDKKNNALFYGNDNVISIYAFNENLTSKFKHDWDIIKIERLALLYDRNEQTEMTLEEVCKELGKDIKIVKEH